MAEENEPKSVRNITEKQPFRRIRSVVRRRILDRLSESRATVTEIAKEVGLRMPHASAELKRLRDEDLVNSDEETGSRGARLALTAKGWDMLRGDEIVRLKSLDDSPPPENALGRLVSVIGHNILVAFIRKPLDGPLPIPNRPLESQLVAGTDEIQSADWIWAEPIERRARWVDAETYRASSTPVENFNPSSISAWGATIPVWGLQRYRLIDSNPLRLGVGAWFGEPSEDTSPTPPKGIPLDGDWRLGSVTVGGLDVRPSSTVLGINLDRLSKESLLSGAQKNSVTIAPQSLLPAQARSLPIEFLEHWVEIAHPRLRPIDRTQRLNSLREAILSPENIQLRRKVDDSTWRRFRQHWGNSKWTTDHVAPGQMIDTTSLSSLAESTIIAWVTNSELPFNVNMEINNVKNPEKLLRNIPPNFRLLLVSEWEKSSSIICLKPHPVLPSMWSQIVLEDGSKYSVNLGQKTSIRKTTEEILWEIPTCAKEVKDLREELGLVEEIKIQKLSIEHPYEQLMRSAIISYPLGNEDWANRMEGQHPLVAWIASSPQYRWSRWQRIGLQLGAEWIDLMEPSDIPISSIATAAIESADVWGNQISEFIRSRIRFDSNIAHQLRQSGENTTSTVSSWIANTLFSEVAWLTTAQQEDLSKWGFDRFLDNPPNRCQAAITGIDWLAQLYPEKLQPGPEDWRSRARSIAFSLPIDHDLHLWAQLDDWMNLDARPNLTTMRLIIERLPEEWWAPVAETLLTVLSDELDAHNLLESTDVAWPALILRPIGEEHRLPGGTISQHGGVRRTLLARLERLMERSDWLDREDVGNGAMMIADLRDTLQISRTLSKPTGGRTHSRVGWLAVPLHLWPPDEPHTITGGDSRISSRLLKRASGWHAELSRNPLEM